LPVSNQPQAGELGKASGKGIITTGLSAMKEELNRIRNYITYNPAMLSDSMVEIWNDAK
jgi:hypothetical protein